MSARVYVGRRFFRATALELKSNDKFGGIMNVPDDYEMKSEKTR